MERIYDGVYNIPEFIEPELDAFLKPTKLICLCKFCYKWICNDDMFLNAIMANVFYRC